MAEPIGPSVPEREAGRPRIPPVPLALGLGGLIPFWGLALIRVLGPRIGIDPALAGLVLAAYAATILAFLGGLRWGAASVKSDQTKVRIDYVVAVLPQLVGWAALALTDPWRLLVLALAVLVTGPLDRRLVSRGLLPAWMGRLRIILSLGAGAALFLAALA